VICLPWQQEVHFRAKMDFLLPRKIFPLEN
jgi:hypothetical protein